MLIILIISKQTKCQEEETVLVYSCDFDTAEYCNGAIFSNGTGIAYTFKGNAFTEIILGYFITDVSSISKKN